MHQRVTRLGQFRSVTEPGVGEGGGEAVCDPADEGDVGIDQRDTACPAASCSEGHVWGICEDKWKIQRVREPLTNLWKEDDCCTMNQGIAVRVIALVGYGMKRSGKNAVD